MPEKILKPNITAEKILSRIQLRRISTDISAVALIEGYDPITGITVTIPEFNPDLDVGTFLAWVGARVSRSGDPFLEIFKEVKKLVAEGKISTGEKLGEVFKAYSHASVADMTPVYLFIDGAPDFAIIELLYRNSLGGPQHRSSRYQNFSKAEILPIESVMDLAGLSPDLYEYVVREWEELPQMALKAYSKWLPIIVDAHRKRFSGARNAAITTRSYDVARYLLPAGVRSAAMALMPARHWLDLASEMMASPVPVTRDLGGHINAMFRLGQQLDRVQTNSELHNFLGYDHPRNQVKSNTIEIADALLEMPNFKEFLNEYAKAPSYPNPISVEAIHLDTQFTAGMLALGHYIQAIHPLLPMKAIQQWLQHLDAGLIKQLARLMFKNHTDHNPMNSVGDIRSSVELQTLSAYGGVRDLIRQRAAGRFVTIFETGDFESILNMGYSEIYQLTNTTGLEEIAEGISSDMKTYYRRLHNLFYTLKNSSIEKFDPSFIMHLMLLSHASSFSMSLAVIQKVYTYALRAMRNKGGDFNYMWLIQLMLNAEKICDPVIEVLYEDMDVVDSNDFVQFNARG